jgi:hypothetical protein
MLVAKATPETIAPMSTPESIFKPKRKPTSSGVPRTSSPGAIISRRDALVEMSTHWR